METEPQPTNTSAIGLVDDIINDLEDDSDTI